MQKAVKILLFICVLSFPHASAVVAVASIDSTEPLSLDDCISVALERHPQLGIYSYRYEQQNEKTYAATAELLPNIDASASYDRLSYVSTAKRRFLGESQDDYRADLVVTQPLFTGGTLFHERKSALYGAATAEQEYLAERENVIFNVKVSYFKLIFAREILKSKEELLEYAESAYQTAVELNQRTKMPREETVLRLSVQLNEVRQELIAAHENLAIAQKTLWNAMGYNSNAPFEIESLEEISVVSEDLDLPVDITESPEILKISKEIKAADASVKAAQGGYYPQLNAHYSYGYEWAQLPDGHTDWIAGVTLDFNIWDWGKTRAEVKEAKAYKAELQSYGDLIRQRIDLEIASARLKYESAVSRAKLAKTSCAQAKKSLDLFENRYRDALVTSIELLDAQRAFSEAQVSCASSKLDLWTAKAEVERLTGKGYDFK